MGRIKDLLIRAVEAGIDVDGLSLDEIQETIRRNSVMVKSSQAFAAHRADVIAGLQAELVDTFAPAYNSELEDIRRQFTESYEYAVSQADTARNKLLDLADKTRQARVLDLNLRRQKFLDSLQCTMRAVLLDRVEQYGGTIAKEHENGRVVEKVSFLDGSRAKMPIKIHVDWKLFQRL